MNALETARKIATDLISRREDERLEAYDCGTGETLKKGEKAKGKISIGFGHTRGVKAGDRCTRDQALAWLYEDLGHAEQILLNRIPHLLTRLQPYQIAVLISLAYNNGSRPFLQATRFRAALEGLDALQVRELLQEYIKAKVAGVFKVRPGLVDRRWCEGELYALLDCLQMFRAPATAWASRDWKKRLQGFLWLLGFDPGAMDGKIGPRSQAAVRDFQRSEGLEPTGNTELETLIALGLALQARFGVVS